MDVIDSERFPSGFTLSRIYRDRRPATARANPQGTGEKRE
jgi:hypothetical protein